MSWLDGPSLFFSCRSSSDDVFFSLSIIDEDISMVVDSRDIDRCVCVCVCVHMHGCACMRATLEATTDHCAALTSLVP